MKKANYNSINTNTSYTADQIVSNTKKTLKTNLYNLYKKSEISREKLSLIMNVSESTLGNYLNLKSDFAPLYENLDLLLKYCHLSWNDFISGNFQHLDNPLYNRFCGVYFIHYIDYINTITSNKKAIQKYGVMAIYQENEISPFEVKLSLDFEDKDEALFLYSNVKTAYINKSISKDSLKLFNTNNMIQNGILKIINQIFYINVENTIIDSKNKISINGSGFMPPTVDGSIIGGLFNCNFVSNDNKIISQNMLFSKMPLIGYDNSVKEFLNNINYPYSNETLFEQLSNIINKGMLASSNEEKEALISGNVNTLIKELTSSNGVPKTISADIQYLATNFISKLLNKGGI